MKINIKGYTSPLNTKEYNIKLAKRRISSLKNYIIRYDNGVFLKYLNGTSESYGKLELIEEPIGEEQASKLVSDNINDKRNSVYSRAAALERRIQIILYSSDFSGAQKLRRKKLTKMEFLTKYQDLGEVKSGEKRHVKYYFQNIGKNDLTIQNIEVSCGCTAVDYPKYALKSGEKGVINVSYDSKDRKGIEEESLIITANVPGDYIVLNFAAIVIDSK